MSSGYVILLKLCPAPFPLVSVSGDRLQKREKCGGEARSRVLGKQVLAAVDRVMSAVRKQYLSLGQEDPWRSEWQPTPIFLPGELQGQTMGSQRVTHD